MGSCVFFCVRTTEVWWRSLVALERWRVERFRLVCHCCETHISYWLLFLEKDCIFYFFYLWRWCMNCCFSQMFVYVETLVSPFSRYLLSSSLCFAGDLWAFSRGEGSRWGFEAGQEGTICFSNKDNFPFRWACHSWVILPCWSARLQFPLRADNHTLETPVECVCVFLTITVDVQQYANRCLVYF